MLTLMWRGSKSVDTAVGSINELLLHFFLVKFCCGSLSSWKSGGGNSSMLLYAATCYDTLATTAAVILWKMFVNN
jgi:hypothetical protein